MMKFIADILTAALEGLADKGVIDWYPDVEGGMPETFECETEIEWSKADESDYVGNVRMLGYYVFLWKLHGILEAYAIDEICQLGDNDHTSTLPLMDIDGKRVCITCARKLARPDVQAIAENMMREYEEDLAYLKAR